MTSEAAVKKNTPKTAALSFSAFSMERRARPAESRAQFFSEISYLLLSQFGSRSQLRPRGVDILPRSI